MEGREVIEELRSALIQLQESGRQEVAIPALLTFLRAVEQDALPAAETTKLQHESMLAHYSAQREGDLAFYRAQQENEIEMFRSVLEAAKIALTTSILVNGGATVALLAFLSNLIGKPSPAPMALQAPLVVSLMCFAGGVLVGAVATGSAYLTQCCYSNRWNRWGTVFQVISVALVIGTYLAFLGGVVSTYHALMK